MFCKNCGNEVADNTVICPHCGVQIGEVKNSNENSEMNSLSIVGFVLSFFISIAGLICSIIAYRQIRDKGGNGKGFAIAGIVIGATFLAIKLIYIIWAFGIFGCMICSAYYYY